jgi:hypothetical protein
MVEWYEPVRRARGGSESDREEVDLCNYSSTTVGRPALIKSNNSGQRLNNLIGVMHCSCED